MVCLDTAAVIEYIRGNKKVGDIVDAAPDNTIAITVITRYELLRQQDVGKRRATAAVMEKFVLLTFSRKAADFSAAIYEKLKSKGTMINENDILISGIAMAENELLVATDRDFEKVEGLNVTIIS